VAALAADVLVEKLAQQRALTQHHGRNGLGLCSDAKLDTAPSLAARVPATEVAAPHLLRCAFALLHCMGHVSEGTSGGAFALMTHRRRRCRRAHMRRWRGSSRRFRRRRAGSMQNHIWRLVAVFGRFRGLCSDCARGADASLTVQFAAVSSCCGHGHWGSNHCLALLDAPLRPLARAGGAPGHQQYRVASGALTFGNRNKHACWRVGERATMHTCRRCASPRFCGLHDDAKFPRGLEMSHSPLLSQDLLQALPPPLRFRLCIAMHAKL